MYLVLSVLYLTSCPWADGRALQLFASSPYSAGDMSEGNGAMAMDECTLGDSEDLLIVSALTQSLLECQSRDADARGLSCVD
ncbi:hypothetical protein V8C26DRAFT_279926 [Trichoderma gracile]